MSEEFGTFEMVPAGRRPSRGNRDNAPSSQQRTVLRVSTGHSRHEGPLLVATDGSAIGNPGPGGWCWFVDEQTYEAGGDPGPVTNNQMELIALTRCLLALGERTDAVIEVDSQYVLNAVGKWHHSWRRNGWRNSKGEPVANRELIEKLLELLEDRHKAGTRTDLRWVKAHNGSWRNENADTRAREAAGSAVSAGRVIVRRVGSLNAD